MFGGKVEFMLTLQRVTESAFLYCSPIPNRTLLMEVSEESPECPSGKSNMQMIASMEHWWNDTDGEN